MSWPESRCAHTNNRVRGKECVEANEYALIRKSGREGTKCVYAADIRVRRNGTHSQIDRFSARCPPFTFHQVASQPRDGQDSYRCVFSHGRATASRKLILVHIGHMSASCERSLARTVCWCGEAVLTSECASDVRLWHCTVQFLIVENPPNLSQSIVMVISVYVLSAIAALSLTMKSEEAEESTYRNIHISREYLKCYVHSHRFNLQGLVTTSAVN